MKRLIIYGLLGLLAYGLFLIFTLPAALVLEQAARYSPGLQAETVDGSVLSGSATGLAVRDTSLANLSWRFEPLALMWGRLQYQLRAEEPELAIDATASIGLTGVLRVDDVQGTLPFAKALSLALRNTLPLTGTIHLDLDNLQIGLDGLPHSATGVVRLNATRTTIGRSFELGDFQLLLDTQDGQIRGEVRDLDGPLELQGTLNMDPQGRFRLDARVAVRDPNNQELQQVLALVGQPDADGMTRVQVTGVLRV